MRPRPGRDRQHRRAPPGQVRRGVERVTAVVTAAGQHDNPCPVDPAEERGTDRREPGRRALHEGTGGQLRHQFGFGRADRGNLVSFAHEVTVLPGGTTPRNPPLRSAPARWYFAGTPALAGPRGPGSLAGYDRLAVARAHVRRRRARAGRRTVSGGVS